MKSYMAVVPHLGAPTMKKSGLFIGLRKMRPCRASETEPEPKSDILHEMNGNLAEDQAPDSSTVTRRDIVAVTLLGLAVRLAWIRFGSWESSDSSWYLTTARNLAFHHLFSAGIDNDLYPTAYRPPLYSAMVAGLWFGDSAPIGAVLVAQAILGAGTAALVYLIARKPFNRRIALIASAGLALAPMTGRFTAVVLTETLFTFLVTLGVFFWSRERYALTGTTFGLAILTRTTLLPFVLALPLLTFVPGWRPQRRAYATVMFLALAVVSVWIIRNALVFRQFIPVAAAGSGTNLLLGTLRTREADDVSARKAFLQNVDHGPAETNRDEMDFDRMRRWAALQRIKADPLSWLQARAGQYPRLFIDSGSYLIGNNALSLRATLHAGQIPEACGRIVFIALNLTVFVFALLGMAAERTRLIALSHIVLFPIFLAVIHLPFWIEPRYGLPMMPLVAILAAAGLASNSDKIFSRRPAEKFTVSAARDRE